MPAVKDVGQEPRPLVGIALKVISVAIFVAMSSLIKYSGDVPPGQIVFFRSFFAMFPILAMLAWRKELATAFKTDKPLGHVARGLVGVFSMACGFYGLTKLPLPDAITLNYAQPLLVVVFSAIFMGEVVRIYRWSAVMIGFIGVVIIAWPKLTLLTGEAGLEAGQGFGVIAVLVGACGSAIAMLLVRRLVQTEKTATIVLWFSATATIISLFTLPFGWIALTWSQTLALIGAGICGGVAQILMTQCYRHAELSTIAPFEYTSMILAIVVGYFVFQDVPTLYTLVGGLIVVGAGLFIIWRERRLGLKRPAARRFVPPSP
ncbi:DMT family transporter [Nitratireductor basaltis]|uniref:Membrane protein n=1 Tax=Nitratireductor basaltis TaxID=472175 RepID=A0A084UCD8_9HYPH|nr:DMT family transporter [Nitratireductor basaltis]KFB10624.1 Membrane protein [Nitratireductor basaltis]